MAVKDFKPDTYFSRKVDLEMAIAVQSIMARKNLSETILIQAEWI